MASYSRSKVVKIPASPLSGEILAPNGGRRSFSVENLSNKSLYLLYSTELPTTNLFTVVVAAGGRYTDSLMGHMENVTYLWPSTPVGPACVTEVSDPE